jgi:hypothetical protein
MNEEKWEKVEEFWEWVICSEISALESNNTYCLAVYRLNMAQQQLLLLPQHLLQRLNYSYCNF